MVEIKQLFLTKNNCYKRGRRHTVKGIMYHSTGVDNPKLSRYVGPDDGILGKNPYGNHWNTPTPGGRSVCVHAFIGKDKNGVVRIYQTLPWDYAGWHSGTGSKGASRNANNTGYIGFEICEDALNDKAYFDECIRLANLLTAHLVKLYKIPINSTTIIDHAEGHKLGIASNHGDIQHWIRRYGMTMNDIRKEVKRLVDGDVTPTPKPVQPTGAIKVGDRVTVKKTATHYATGQSMANFVKGNTYTVSRVEPNRVLLKEITSWVNVSDLEGAKPAPVPTPKPEPEKKTIPQISVNGYWDSNTTKSLQRALGGVIDGVISGQYPNAVTNSIPSASFTTRSGSGVIRLLQRKIGVKDDGYIGVDTVKALQKYLGTIVDGKLSKPSMMVRELQRRLNAGTF